MPSPLAALMGLADGAMGLLQKVFNKGGDPSGFEAQLTSALEGGPQGGMPLLQKLMADQGGINEERLEALLENPEAVPLLQYLSTFKSMGLTSSDVKALLLGETQGISDEGMKTVLAACGFKEADIASIMADPEGLAGLKANLAQTISDTVRQQLAGSSLDVGQFIEEATADQSTYDAVVIRFVLSKGSPMGTARHDENGLYAPKTTPADIAKITAEIKESIIAAVKNPVTASAAETVFAEAVQSGQGANVHPAAVIQAAEGMDALENTFNIPRNIVRDLVFSTDPQVRQAAVEEATARIISFLDANAGKELPRQAMQALSLLKGALSQQEFTRIDQALQAFNQDLAATIQPFTIDKAVFDVLVQNLGDEPAGTAGRYTREVMDQIRQAVPTAVRGNEGSLSLKLNPPMLGRVDIDIRVEDGQILASFKVEQPVTRDILQQNMHVLKEALNEQGIKATQFVVTTDTFNARDHREALAWGGTGNGRGGNPGQGRGQGSESPARNHEEYGNGYAPARRYADGGGLDIFA